MKTTVTTPEVSPNGLWEYTRERDWRRWNVRRTCTTCRRGSIAGWWNREIMDNMPCKNCESGK